MRLERPLPPDDQPPRITELWAWTNVDPMTDTEAIMAWKLPTGGAMPLVATIHALAERMRPVAEAAIRSAQEPRPVAALRRFVPAPLDEDERNAGVLIPWYAGQLMGILARKEARRLSNREIAELTHLSEGTIAAIRHDWGVTHR